MDSGQYHKIKTSLKLERDERSLAVFFIQNVAIAASILAIWTISRGSGFHFLAIPLLTVLIFRHFSYMHEAVHKAVSTNIWVNDLVGVFSGAVCILPFEPWKRSHLEHHVWTGNIEKDPVTAIVTAFPKMHRLTRGTLSLFWQTWFPMLACMQYVVFWWLASKIYIKKPRSVAIPISLIAPIAFWSAVTAAAPAGFFLTIILPSIILYMVAVEVVNLPHHLHLPQNTGKTRLLPWEQYQVARTCVYPRWFARLVVLNFNYHTEHHMYPDVPWYHLEKLHSEITPLLGESYNSDPYFKWILENKPLPIDEVIKAHNPDKNPVAKSA